MFLRFAQATIRVRIAHPTPASSGLISAHCWLPKKISATSLSRSGGLASVTRHAALTAHPPGRTGTYRPSHTRLRAHSGRCSPITQNYLYPPYYKIKARTRAVCQRCQSCNTTSLELPSQMSMYFFRQLRLPLNCQHFRYRPCRSCTRALPTPHTVRRIRHENQSLCHQPRAVQDSTPPFR